MITAEQLVAKAKEMEEERKRREGIAAPPKTPKDSPASNLLAFWTLTSLAFTGALAMMITVLYERPGAFLPLMLFLGTAAGGLGVMHAHIFSPESAALANYRQKAWIRWLTATGVIIALILAGGTLLALPTILWPAR